MCIGSGYAQTYDCESDRFRCYNGDCIAGDLLCDGTPHCRDSSDETEAECTKPEILCHRYAFRCNYGACVNGDSVCNGVQDCIDNSDETQPQCVKNTTNNQTERPTSRPNRCTTNQITCDNGECIHKDNMCNGIRDCADGSDETSEKCRSIYCPPTAFRCSYGACINGDLRCNGVVECVDGSDEDSRCSETGWPSPLPTIRPTTETTRWPVPTPTPTRGTNTCRAPPQPQNGRWKLHQLHCSDRQECNVLEGTELGLGFRLIYSCNSGYKLIGQADVSCFLEGKWLDIPVCTEIRCKGLTTASIRATCTYNNKWIPCESPVPPSTKAVLECQTISYQPETNLLTGQRRDVSCNENGQWEPEPMRCIAVCGTLPPLLKPTIVGGVLPSITEFPWHATMYRDVPGNESKKFFCGATIIQEELLITAAHCVYDENNKQPINARSIYILTGNIFRDYDYPHNSIVQKNQVKQIYIVRNYQGLTGNYLWDIAILELVKPFVLSTWLVPVCIDTINDRSLPEVGSSGKVAGFGRTASGESSAVLQALTVPVIPFSQCISASQNANTQQFINDKFCAGHTNGSSVCDGDSGGGLVFQTNNLWYLRGIVSVSLGTIQKDGIAYCDNNLYSLYTTLSRHISWIQDVITKIDRNQTHTLCSDESQTRCS